MDNGSFYDITTNAYVAAGKRLCAYALRLSELPDGTLVSKEKGGKKYYYLNRRVGKKVISEYVGFGKEKLTEVKAKLDEGAVLKEKCREEQREREACEHALQYKKWKHAGNYDFSLYYNNILVADVFTGDTDVRIYRYETSPGMQLFCKERMTRYELGEVLASRCWDENRENLDLYLAKLGLDCFNVYEICRKTHGIMLQDLFWFRFVGEKFDGTKILRRYGLA
jgi:hypothetical protein